MKSWLPRFLIKSLYFGNQNKFTFWLNIWTFCTICILKWKGFSIGPHPLHSPKHLSISPNFRFRSQVSKPSWTEKPKSSLGIIFIQCVNERTQDFLHIWKCIGRGISFIKLLKIPMARDARCNLRFPGFKQYANDLNGGATANCQESIPRWAKMWSLGSRNFCLAMHGCCLAKQVQLLVHIE